MACQIHTQSLSSYSLSATVRPLCLSIARSQPRRGDACVTHVVEDAGSPSPVKATRSAVFPFKGDQTGTSSVKVASSRPPSTPPSPPSLIHSPVYVQKALIKQPQGEGASSAAPSPPSNQLEHAESSGEEAEAQEGNSLIWALKQVDRSLDELEQRPLPLQRELYELSCGPVGAATSSALAAAAKVTVAATREAVRAALPVGQWLVREGGRAAVSLVSAAVAEAAARQLQQQGQQGRGAQGMQGGGGAGGNTTKIRVNKRA
ncbi:hypothetical protein Agub_g12228 [Astrephomene gubernaculifera]|uniref:Uncharacterized protein n=1 Tax=Astrephomene gubernaculifera TaxID=47775 RepID=A0AAD3DXY0_9CHLO|nr:hypothetical protein Agub_g12228 [Astrephomene gubernaculifera]